MIPSFSCSPVTILWTSCAGSNLHLRNKSCITWEPFESPGLKLPNSIPGAAPTSIPAGIHLPEWSSFFRHLLPFCTSHKLLQLPHFSRSFPLSWRTFRQAGRDAYIFPAIEKLFWSWGFSGHWDVSVPIIISLYIMFRKINIPELYSLIAWELKMNCLYW